MFWCLAAGGDGAHAGDGPVGDPQRDHLRDQEGRQHWHWCALLSAYAPPAVGARWACALVCFQVVRTHLSTAGCTAPARTCMSTDAVRTLPMLIVLSLVLCAVGVYAGFCNHFNIGAFMEKVPELDIPCCCGVHCHRVKPLVITCLQGATVSCRSAADTACRQAALVTCVLPAATTGPAHGRRPDTRPGLLEGAAAVHQGASCVLTSCGTCQWCRHIPRSNWCCFDCWITMPHALHQGSAFKCCSLQAACYVSCMRL